MRTMRCTRTVIVACAIVFALAGPAAVFAQFGIGAAAYSDTPIFAAEDVDRDLLDGSFSFGVNARMKKSLFQFDALAMYASAEESIDLYLTPQLSLDLLKLLRVSAGAGPSLRIPLAGDEGDGIAIDWVNAKVDVDLILFRRLTVGLSFQYLIPSSDVHAIDTSLGRGRIGATVLIW
jgi:hypothetical protein